MQSKKFSEKLYRTNDTISSMNILKKNLRQRRICKLKQATLTNCNVWTLTPNSNKLKKIAGEEGKFEYKPLDNE